MEKIIKETKSKLTDIVILWFGTEFKHKFRGKYRETMELLSKYALENWVRFVNSSVYQYDNKNFILMNDDILMEKNGFM